MDDANTEREKEGNFPIVAIGASAGGLEALQELFEHLPPDRISCVVIQHLAPEYKSLIAQILSKKTKMSVLEAKEGSKLHVNCVYTIPPDTFITVLDGGILHLTPRKDEVGLFLPIDRFFFSLAKVFQERAIGIILSGGGSDGALGIQEIKERGGIVFAQNEDSAKFPSMPQNAIHTGVVDFVLSPKGIGEKLRQIFQEGNLGGRRDAHRQEIESNELKSILKYVHKNAGIDFSNYKVATLSRRILRRMVFRGISTPQEYQEVLKGDAAETRSLCQDILIQVTKFFRDPKCFEFLTSSFFPTLVKGRSPHDPIRIWVPGCSSGEEVYSILISLTEFLKEKDLKFPIQLFGTDINETAIQKARAGIYVENAICDVSTERLGRFFVKENEKYAINKSLRDQCIFAKHNLLTDPPFAKLDLISCQNLLIYFDTILQKQVLSIFHYALKPTGVLLLGKAETTGANSKLFASLDNAGHAYSKVSARNHHLYFDFMGAQKVGERITEPGDGAEAVNPRGVEIATGLQIQKEADRLLIAEFTPPGVIFNDHFEVIQFRGLTGPYFEHSPGVASLDLFKMLKGGLIADVRAAIDECRGKGERIRKENILLRVGANKKRLAFDLFPLRLMSSTERFFLLTFEDMDLPAIDMMNRRRLAKEELSEHSSSSEEVNALRAELKATKDYLQSINEEKETANEELKAANEEIMSSNEELQSTNEELHTAKEELQSTNEELLTVNEELQVRNRELSQASDDLSNLFNSLNVAVVMVNRDLRIRKLTTHAQNVLGCVASDVGRLVADVRQKIRLQNIEKVILGVIQSMVSQSFEIQDEEGKWYSVLIRPYRTSDDRIDGAILLFTDVNELKTSLEYSQAIEETIGNPILVLTHDLRVKRANQKFLTVFEMAQENLEGKFIYQLGGGSWNIPSLRVLLEEILAKDSSFHNFKMVHEFPGIGKKSMRLSGRRLFHNNKKTETILLVFDVIDS